MKAIETVYNGYRFRSRLEARWAVFFDEAGIKYQYELEGFELDNGQWYLPDFWLPGIEIWVEIKRWTEFNPSDFVMDIINKLDGFKEDIICIFGEPHIEKNWSFLLSDNDVHLFKPIGDNSHLIPSNILIQSLLVDGYTKKLIDISNNLFSVSKNNSFKKLERAYIFATKKRFEKINQADDDLKDQINKMASQIYG